MTILAFVRSDKQGHDAKLGPLTFWSDLREIYIIRIDHEDRIDN